MTRGLYIAFALLVLPLFILGAAHPYPKEVFTLSMTEFPEEAEMGSYFTIPLSFTNNTTKQHSFSYYKPHFWYPVITDSKTNKTVEVIGEVYDGPVIEITRDVAPGEFATVESWPVHLIDQPSSLNESKLICSPGKYKIYFKISVEVDGKNVTLVSETKELNVK